MRVVLAIVTLLALGGAARADRPAGALAGKTVYVSAGHGFTWVDSLGRWATQRPNTHGVVEDLVSVETISQELVPMLWAMGAYVVPVREVAMQEQLVIADGFDVTGGAAVASDARGWSPPAEPITDGTNPFEGGGSKTIACDPAGGTSARWALDVAVEGDYEVYVAWAQDIDRAPDAHYVIEHAGGSADFHVDQRRHGGTWVLLGRYHFAPGAGAIVLENDCADGGVVSADAVRIGGGLGHFDRGGGSSGRPVFEEAARYATQWNGAPASVWDGSDTDGNDDIGARSRFAAWDHEGGEDAVYVAWHSNAPDPARGTVSFVYGPEAYGDLNIFAGTAGSLELLDAVHTELVGDIRAAWDPVWQDRGQHTGYFGEINPSNNPEMPAILLEIAFHDTLEDANALRDPRFRRIAARAIAEGIARYFATRDGATLVLPPEPPSAVRMTQDEAGLHLAWDAPDPDPAGGDAATAYRVYLSHDGVAFDDGVDVAGTSLDVDDAGPIFARVTARNDGGESRGSPVVGAVRAPGGRARVLVIAGFARLDGAMLIPEDLSAFDLGVVERGFLDRINDETHAARHGLALAAAGYSFDIATAAAFRRGEVALDSYAAVSWAGGAELTPLNAADQLSLALYTGAVILSGTGVGDARDLLTDLGLSFVAADAGTRTAGEYDFGDDGPHSFDARDPDVLDGPAHVVDYDTGGGACVAGAPVTGAACGFPLETIGDTDARARLYAALLETQEIEPDLDTGDAGGCCSAGGGDPAAGLLVFLLWSVPHVVRRHRRRARRSRAHHRLVHPPRSAR